MHSCTVVMFFPECVARVPVSLWGCVGRAVFARRCATVRNRPREDHMAVPMAGAILLPRFQKMRCRRNTLETSHVILRGKRSTLDVSCCVFFANRIVSTARSGDMLQIPWQAWHFVTYHENRRKPRTKRRFWGWFVRKHVGKGRFWSCKVWKVRKSRTKCLFWCSNMSRLE